LAAWAFWCIRKVSRGTRKERGGDKETRRQEARHIARSRRRVSSPDYPLLGVQRHIDQLTKDVVVGNIQAAPYCWIEVLARDRKLKPHLGFSRLRPPGRSRSGSETSASFNLLTHAASYRRFLHASALRRVAPERCSIPLSSIYFRGAISFAYHGSSSIPAHANGRSHDSRTSQRR
jgi:hypothetical protein